MLDQREVQSAMGVKEGFPGDSVVKNLPAIAGDTESQVQSLEKGMAASNILAWRVPWAEEPGKLQSMGSQRVGHD